MKVAGLFTLAPFCESLVRMERILTFLSDEISRTAQIEKMKLDCFYWVFFYPVYDLQYRFKISAHPCQIPLFTQ